MVLRKSIVLNTCLFLLLLTSCFEVAKEIQDWTQYKETNNIEGKKHFLENDGIKIFLPESFERYNAVEYLALIDSLIVNNEDLEIEHSRLKNMREMTGNHYIYFDSSVNSSYTINTIPYAPITRQDAKYLLGLIRLNQEEASNITDLDYTKITAKHIDNGDIQIFKAIFKIENIKLQHQAFQHVYFVSSNNKTVLINLTTPFDVNFDPFLEKMVL